MNNYSAAGLVTRTFDTLGIDAFPGPPPRSTARRTNLVRIPRCLFGAKRSRERGPGTLLSLTLVKTCSMSHFS